MGNLTKRLAELEKRNRPAGKFVACYMIHEDGRDLTQEERAAKLAAANDEAGEFGQVIAVEYVKDWRATERRD